MAKKRSVKQPLEIGTDLAAQTLERRRVAALARSRAIAKIPAPKAARGARPMVAARPPPQSAGLLIAEGDSWFDYPFHDVLNDLEDHHGFDVESVAHKGDTVENMAYAGGQLDNFARRVEKALRSNVRPRAILLSGGGNDVAGEEFRVLLNHALAADSGLNESIVKGVVDERVHDAYATILGAITALCKAQVGDTVPIIVHGYDYPVPDGRGYLGGWGPLPGPWLEPGFREKGYTDMSVRRQLCVELIDRFNAMLQGITAGAAFAHVHYLDLRNTLRNDRKYEEYWANELHPTEKGFEMVTDKFAALVNSL